MSNNKTERKKIFHVTPMCYFSAPILCWTYGFIARTIMVGFDI